MRLDELGTITDATAEQRTYATLAGEPIVAFAVTRAKGQSDTVVVTEVQKQIETLRKKYPDVEIKEVDNTVPYTLGVYDATMKSLLEGAFLAIVVVLLFLRDWRATIIAAVALPLSIVPAFWMLDIANFSLNLVSCSPSPSWWAFWWTTRSWRSRISSATSTWARALIAPRWKPLTRSASP